MSDYRYSEGYKKGRAAGRRGESYSTALDKLERLKKYKALSDQDQAEMREGLREGIVRGGPKGGARNPAPLKPKYGKFIKAEAIRFNRNGTVSIKTRSPGAAVKKRAPKKRTRR